VDYLAKLNAEQRIAVEHGAGPLLVLAGAGSGKTRVLTHRIAHLIHHFKVHPSEIFAVTFTNKAAAEMRHRVFDLLHTHPYFTGGGREVWVSTFHSSCMRILRSEIHHLGYMNQFTIYDDSDQLSVIKACMKEFHFNDSSFSPKAFQSRINKLKNDGTTFDDYKPSFGGPFEDAFARLFERYTQVLKKSSAVDFADLILLTVKLFQNFPRVAENYQNRFPFVMIDEYQDTNRCQYLLMKLLAGRDSNLCAVGDEDQSIYRWRGADISNILNFEKDYPNAKIFKLEQNYRSSRNIIEAASALISHNTERRDKKLWTDNPEGAKIVVLEAYDEHDEAAKVAGEVMSALNESFSLNQVAIFYRTNAQSRLLEDQLRSKGLQYAIYGGLKFYDRLEVKDTLAYLKLVCNPADDVSFRRIVNVPARGIGAVSLDKLVARARAYNASLFEILESAFGPNPTVSLDMGRTENKFRAFYDLMVSLRNDKRDLLPSDLVTQVIEASGYRKMLTDEHSTESQSRLENLAQLRQSVTEFELRSGADNPDRPLTVEGFLEEIALVSDIDRFDPNAPALKMMTMHMAKGLEFDVVFIVGLEEELFPSIRPWEPEQPGDVEEERRLMYVGMTRARKKLHLLYAKNRMIFGNSGFRVMSRFIDEIPREYLEEKRADYFNRRRGFIERPGLLPFEKSRKPADTDEFAQVTDYPNEWEQSADSEEGGDGEGSYRLGARVMHPLFGEGVVRRSIGQDKLIIEFAGRGLKKISLKFTQLKVL
jgi:DNA helicase-2/ATP-dependent DNA helicase PcrA